VIWNCPIISSSICVGIAVWAFWAKVALFGIFEDLSLGLDKCVMYLFISHSISVGKSCIGGFIVLELCLKFYNILHKMCMS
jgi:hypothetical protein